MYLFFPVPLTCSLPSTGATHASLCMPATPPGKSQTQHAVGIGTIFFVLFHVAERSSRASLYQQLLSNAQTLQAHWLLLDFRFFQLRKNKTHSEPKVTNMVSMLAVSCANPCLKAPDCALPLPALGDAARPWWEETMAHSLGFSLGVT